MDANTVNVITSAIDFSSVITGIGVIATAIGLLYTAHAAVDSLMWLIRQTK